MTLVDRTTGFAVKENGVNLAFNVQRSPFDTFTPDASMDVRLRINYRKQMTLTDHILHVYVCEGKFKPLHRKRKRIPVSRMPAITCRF